MTNKCKHETTTEKHLCDKETGEVYKIGVYCADCGKWITWIRQTENKDLIMPFGEHKGKKISEVPLSYRRWFINNSKNKRIIEAMKEVSNAQMD